MRGTGCRSFARFLMGEAPPRCATISYLVGRCERYRAKDSVLRRDWLEVDGARLFCVAEAGFSREGGAYNYFESVTLEPALYFRSVSGKVIRRL